MMIYRLSLMLVLMMIGSGVFPQDQSRNPDVFWTPEKDEIYLQEFAEKIPTASPVTSITAHGSTCYAVMDGKIHLLKEGRLIAEGTAPAQVRRLFNEQNRLWAVTAEGTYTLIGKRWTKIDDREYVDMCMHNGSVHAITREEVYRWSGDRFVSIKPAGGYLSNSVTNLMEDGSQVYITPVRLGPVAKVASYSGTLYMLRNNKILSFDGKSLDEDFIDWGRIPGSRSHDLIRYENRLIISTNRGLGELRGAAVTAIKGKDGLPVEATTCLANGFDHDLWIGTERGAVRMTKDKEFHYFSEGLFLPHQKVNEISAGEREVYIATDGGIGIIHYEPFTLAKKADWFEKHLDSWGFKRMGFIHYMYKKNGKWIREITDNDGEHTAQYLAAMSYKYAVTKDPRAREEAVEAFKAMIWLNKVTGTDGFIARAIWSPDGDEDERAIGGSGGLPAKWYQSADGKWYWKGDTSSDEIVGHYYAVAIFYDLVAEGIEKEIAREHLRKMSSYIIDCGWTMHDMDGQPTRWARWNPEYLLRPYGYMDRGINGLEVLSFMQTAIHATGEQKFRDGYQQLIGWGYPQNTIRQKNTFPPEDIAPWDDNLAFMSYYLLLRYETDPVLRSIYLRSLERTWAVKRIDQYPWFNYIYAALTGNAGEFDITMKFLREWSLDTRQLSYSNSHRDDLFLEPGYASYDGTEKILSPREVYIGMDGRRPNRVDSQNEGNSAKPPLEYLKAYWMGRYYGFILSPDTIDPRLLTTDENYMDSEGSTPYSGQGRPEIY